MTRDHNYLKDVATDQIVGLIFELASQIHVERARRIALEALLERKGVMTLDALEDRRLNDRTSDKSNAELDRSMRRLMRIICESGESASPLRAEHGFR